MARVGHDRLPTFGVGADLDRRTWQSVFRQLVAGGLLEVDVDGFGGMRLAGDAAKVLRGERSAAAAPRSDAGCAEGARATRVPRSRRPLAWHGEAERDLFEALRAKRSSSPRRTASPRSWCSRTAP